MAKIRNIVGPGRLSRALSAFDALQYVFDTIYSYSAVMLRLAKRKGMPTDGKSTLKSCAKLHRSKVRKMMVSGGVVRVAMLRCPGSYGLLRLYALAYMRRSNF